MRFLVFLFICACGTPGGLVNQPNQDISPDVFSSVVPIRAHAFGDMFSSTGTGFFVHPNLVVTAYHVVDSVDERAGTIDIMNDPTTSFGLARSYIVASDREKDLAVLYTGAMTRPPLTLCPKDEPHFAVAVRSLVRYGDIIYRLFPGIALAGAKADDFLSADVEPGTSGGPVISYGFNCVTGVVAYGYNGQHITGFVKSQELLDLIKNNEHSIKRKMKKLSKLF